MMPNKTVKQEKAGRMADPDSRMLQSSCENLSIPFFSSKIEPGEHKG